MLQWGLLSGTLPAVLIVLAVAGAVALIVAPVRRRWWTVVLPAIGIGAIGVALLIDWLVTGVWHASPHPLPKRVVGWIAIMLAALAVAVVTLIRASARRRAIAVVAALVVCLAGLNQINRAYHYAPTLAAAFGQAPPAALAPIQQIPLPRLVSPSAASSSAHPDSHASARATSAAPTSRPATSRGGSASTSVTTPPSTSDAASPLASWRPDGPLPDAAVSEVTIPGTVSHFHARIAWVYLPPAYRVSNRPDLPVLILLPGQPGGPHNWLSVGHLGATMDEFAASHHGLAPIVIMPDATGSHMGNTMCVDSRLGNADTYLSVDVVSWAKTHLQVDPNTAHWAVGGYSFGGTCSLQLAVTHPTTFPTFLDISGEVEPTLGSADESIAKAFGGDAAAYRAIQPLHMLAADRSDPARSTLIRAVDGTFAVGAQDTKYTAEQNTVTAACRRAGMIVHTLSIPGAHSWDVATAALQTALPQMALRMGLP